MNSPVPYSHGHRSRVKDRFLREGIDTFADYEILEFLLFYTIPRRDTKGIAHALIDTFGTLHGALTADEGALCSISGIGPHVARFLSTLLPFSEYMIKEERGAIAYDSAERLAALLYDVLRKGDEGGSALLLFNNRKELLRIVRYPRDVTVDALLGNIPMLAQEAFATNASSIAIGYYKDSGIPFPDSVTIDLLRSFEFELLSLGISLTDVICLTKRQYNSLLRLFKAGRSLVGASEMSPAIPVLQDEEHAQHKERTLERLTELLRLTTVRSRAECEAQQLVTAYPALNVLSTIPYETLTERDGVSSSSAILIKLLVSSYARAKVSEALYVHKSFSRSSDLGRFFSDAIGMRSRETMALALFDRDMRLIDFKLCGKGTVNVTVFTHRELAEMALSKSAHFAALAHNHPLGKLDPSAEDLSTTAEACRVFRGIGVTLVEHYVVNETDFLAIEHAQRLSPLLLEKGFFD